MSKKHQKHTKLNKPALGQFNRQEWAILGTNCGNIQRLCRDLIKQLYPAYNPAYVDADHKNADDTEASTIENALNSGAGLEYMDMIDYHRFETKNPFTNFQYRSWFNQQDMALVNGNHFKANRQIVVIDSKKKDSLHRKLDRLSNVDLFLFVEGETEIYDFLKTHIENWENIPRFQLSQSVAISDWLDEQLQKNLAPLKGLVLAGGKSQRMGQDKTQLAYHGVPQTAYVQNLLNAHCDEVFLSCRADQVSQFENEKLIKDTFTGLGPFGAILSAFREYPDAAWLVTAIDLPLVDDIFLRELIDHRNHSKNATAFLNPATGFPDPLLTIWEPRSYPILLQFLAQGYSCPRKVLINSEIELLETKQAHKLRNVNSPEDYEAILPLLKK